MKILYLIAENLPTDRVDVACLFGKYLPKYNVHSDLATGVLKPDVAANWGGGQAIVCSVKNSGFLKNLKKFVHATRTVLKSNNKTYDAIQVRDMPILAALILLLTRIKGQRFCYWMSYPITEGQARRASLYRQGGFKFKLKAIPLTLRSSIGQWLLYHYVLPQCHHLFVQSEEMLKTLERKAIPKSKMTVVPMCVDVAGVEVKNITPFKDVTLKEKKILVYIGTLNPEREIEKLIAMMPLILAARKDVVLILVGGCAEQKNLTKLKSFAQSLNLGDSIIFTGWQPMSKAWEYVKAAEIGLSPIPRGPLLDVGSPTKVMEYLALGLPVVANDNPDQQQVLLASGAGVCVPYTSEDFAQAVLKLLDETAAQRELRVSKGFAYVKKNRDYRAMAEKLAGRYCEILNDKK